MYQKRIVSCYSATKWKKDFSDTNLRSKKLLPTECFIFNFMFQLNPSVIIVMMMTEVFSWHDDWSFQLKHWQKFFSRSYVSIRELFPLCRSQLRSHDVEFYSATAACCFFCYATDLVLFGTLAVTAIIVTCTITAITVTLLLQLQ